MVVKKQEKLIKILKELENIMVKFYEKRILNQRVSFQ